MPKETGGILAMEIGQGLRMKSAAVFTTLINVIDTVFKIFYVIVV